MARPPATVLRCEPWRSPAGIRSAISSRCTNNSVISSVPTRPAGRRRDLYETAEEFVLTAELPGLSREEIEIQVEDSRIVIRGARSGGGSTREIPCEQYHRVERGHGRFSRGFSLPEPIEAGGVTADLKDGILTVTIPKARDRAARRIDVT